MKKREKQPLRDHFEICKEFIKPFERWYYTGFFRGGYNFCKKVNDKYCCIKLFEEDLEERNISFMIEHNFTRP